ncbi:MAG: efflux transporter periplasmic adaptor subunit, partial [Candidatus Aminicenantes bacterium]|nr:efflux transporter periplasmic adaptor subunit [Candidatus Aminicenantes bacterium]
NIILDRRGVKTVFVVDRGVALERKIETGIENVDEAEVTSGLQPSDRIVTEGFETLRNRSRVKVIE